MCAIKAEYDQACADEEQDERARSNAENIVFAKTKQDTDKILLEAQTAIRANASSTSHTLLSQLKQITKPNNLHQMLINQSNTLFDSLTIKQR